MKPKEGYKMMRRLLKKGTYVVLGILCCMFIWMQFGVDSYAFKRTTGEVTGSSVKVRKEAGTDSDVVASVKAGNKLDVTDAVNGSDGKVWYKIMIGADEYGYIRSDFVSLEGGEQSPSNTTDTTTDTNASNTPSEVTPMDKQNAHTNTDNVKVRKQATTGSAEVDRLNKDQDFIVSGTAKGPDGKVWYQVSYSDNGKEMNGFIRSDLVTLTGAVEEPEVTPEPPVEEEPAEPTVPDAPTPSENYEAVYTTDENGEYIWYLYNRTAGQRYKIGQLLQVDKNDKDELERLSDANFALKIWLIIVVCILVMGVVVVIFYFLRLREEEESMPRRRTSVGTQVARTPRSGGTQSNVRPQTIAQPAVKPQSTSGQTVKAQGMSQQTTRTQGMSQTKSPSMQGAKPQPAQTERPSVANVQAQKQKTSWKAKNFLDDNDEFEFGFLDFDEDE